MSPSLPSRLHSAIRSLWIQNWPDDTNIDELREACLHHIALSGHRDLRTLRSSRLVLQGDLVGALAAFEEARRIHLAIETCEHRDLRTLRSSRLVLDSFTPLTDPSRPANTRHQDDDFCNTFEDNSGGCSIGRLVSPSLPRRLRTCGCRKATA